MKLTRTEQNDFATYGTLADDDGTPLGVTLELPWRDNQAQVSCIPAGTYHAVRFHSPHFGVDLFQLTDVPGREAVEIHVGNLPVDVRGCIIVGQARGDVNGQPGIVRSRLAFAALMAHLVGVDAITLTVEESWTGSP